MTVGLVNFQDLVIVQDEITGIGRLVVHDHERAVINEVYPVTVPELIGPLPLRFGDIVCERSGLARWAAIVR